jgi:hypothetical protein
MAYRIKDTLLFLAVRVSRNVLLAPSRKDLRTRSIRRSALIAGTCADVCRPAPSEHAD